MQEIDSYLQEPVIEYSDDRDCLLRYWKESSYLTLKEVALKFLCAPPSSVESERVFSGLGNVYTDKRNRLSADHAHMQLFLSYTYKK